MSGEIFLAIVFISITVSIISCRWFFYDYFKANNWDSNPKKTWRYISISEVVSYYLQNYDLSEDKKKALATLRRWEITNLVLLPSFVFLILIVELFMGR